MALQPIYDVAEIDFDTPLFTIEEIRQVNPQRYEMEQLTAVVHVDQENHRIAGYKTVSLDEFWCRGHTPGMSGSPGMCPACCNAKRRHNWPGSIPGALDCWGVTSLVSAVSKACDSACRCGPPAGWTFSPGPCESAEADSPSSSFRGSSTEKSPSMDGCSAWRSLPAHLSSGRLLEHHLATALSARRRAFT